jgi:uncharacterized membrane protein
MRNVDLQKEIAFSAGKRKDKQVIWCKFPKNDVQTILITRAALFG